MVAQEKNLISLIKLGTWQVSADQILSGKNLNQIVHRILTADKTFNKHPIVTKQRLELNPVITHKSGKVSMKMSNKLLLIISNMASEKDLVSTELNGKWLGSSREH